MSAGQRRVTGAGGVSLHVEDHGSGTPVLLIHGWPDLGYLWMENSGGCVDGPWRHEVIPGASHWIPLDAPGKLNELLLGWLR